ncbi:MAG: hypothetical protein HYZ09_03880 [Candidatus Kerfeldbacteria bacterium]|nr:hypothetical protein [Candidatus Kerfeldbacteria bacterium]
MSETQHIQRVTAASREVLTDVALENGAIIAANTDKPYYPREADDERYVWPRIGAFVCAAADVLGLAIQEPFFRWLDEKPEDFRKERLLYVHYATNGRLGPDGHRFAPDQMGTVLWALSRHFRGDADRAKPFTDLIHRLADGLAAAWNAHAFVPNTVDVWDDPTRQTSSRVANTFTYSLAACARGLELADHLFPTPSWRSTAQAMRQHIDASFDRASGVFLRTAGRVADRTMDASLLGLLWPFEMVEPTDERFRMTVQRLEERLVFNGGIHRFEFDYTDHEGTAAEGGGAWPVLNFWLSIVLHRLGERERALAYYHSVLERVDTYLPEQLFEDFRVGVYPFAWSHALFILASHEFGLLENAA